MGIFDRFFRGGNIRQAAKAIADRHSELGGEPKLVAIHVLTILGMQAQHASREGDKAVWASIQLRGKRIKNYTDLACLVLWTGSPVHDGYTLDNCKQSFSTELLKYFDEYQIPREYSTGDIASQLCIEDDPRMDELAMKPPP